MSLLGKLTSPAALAIALGVPLGIGAYTARYAEATSYLTDDPEACANCHVMRDHHDGWQKAGHHAYATCNDCHVPVDFVGRYLTKMDHGWRHSKGFTLQDFHEPIQIKESSRRIVQENCVRCHEGVVEPLVSHAAAHGEAPDCIHCHDRAGHGPRR